MSLQRTVILFGIRKNCLISGSSLLLYQFTKRVIKLTIIIILKYYCFQLNTQLIILSSLSLYIDGIIGDRRCGFDITGKLQNKLLYIETVQ
jgi:hypothetical protein